jgi:hypothetical protein
MARYPHSAIDVQKSGGLRGDGRRGEVAPDTRLVVGGCANETQKKVIRKTPTVDELA